MISPLTQVLKTQNLPHSTRIAARIAARGDRDCKAWYSLPAVLLSSDLAELQALAFTLDRFLKPVGLAFSFVLGLGDPILPYGYC